MRIGILTQPLHINYGGLLQAYALQVVLKRMGHEPWTEDRKQNKDSLRVFKQNRLVRLIFGKATVVKLSAEERKAISKYTERFTSENIITTIPIHGRSKKKFDQYKFDAYIVGSDQIWRPYYSNGIYNYFLDFVKGENVNKIAYAASYGVDHSEYTEPTRLKCSKLLKRFNAVSVREHGAIKLTKELFDVDAVHVLDPTMLLNSDDYNNIIDSHPVDLKKMSVMVYILDESTEKSKIVQDIAMKLGCSINQIKITKLNSIDRKKSIDEYIVPPVEEWLAGFRDCNFVVTDSFHGTLFSLIYNKQFITIGNKARGMSRFDSVLSQFDLLDRIIDEDSVDYMELINTSIDFNSINAKREQLKLKSIQFLESALNID